MSQTPIDPATPDQPEGGGAWLTELRSAWAQLDAAEPAEPSGPLAREIAELRRAYQGTRSATAKDLRLFRRRLRITRWRQRALPLALAAAAGVLLWASSRLNDAGRRQSLRPEGPLLGQLELKEPRGVPEVAPKIEAQTQTQKSKPLDPRGFDARDVRELEGGGLALRHGTIRFVLLPATESTQGTR